MANKALFLQQHSWIDRHQLVDSAGIEISKRFLVMKLMYQRNMLKAGKFEEARLFGLEEGLHETTAYRLLADNEVPQQTINDRLEEEDRLQITPTQYRGSYSFLEKPTLKAKLIHDPQTIQQVYWKDKSFELFMQEKDAKHASHVAKKKHLSFEIVRFFNAHRIYWQAIDDLDFYLADIINKREELGMEPKHDFAESMRRHYKRFEDLVAEDFTAAFEYAMAHNFKVQVVDGKRQMVLTKHNNQDPVAQQTPGIPVVSSVRIA